MLKNEVEDMASKEETMWKQRPKALWLAEGDRSTSFFHARANETRLQKEIWKIKDVQGLELNEEAMERVLTSMERRVTEAMNDDLTRPFTLDEITQALHQMHTLKSPGLDEAFNKMISRAKVEGYVEGVAVFRRDPRISHLLFVDDTLIFYQATSQALQGVKQILVSASINSDCKWNKELVEAEFSPLDAKCILGVRLQDTRLQDKLMWHYEKHGRFTVGSAYRVAQE
ncbi:UNVERIFIED_CONTAM: hypothetical protein Sradi_0892300 [Sesamum radiatum]|uniref:Uncharacterized protein n=1 Tax=Sesamum radiatum TaxID=300843 RepID=A0AAW2V3G2_SESRA